MREVIKDISMKDETGSHLIVDNIIGSDAPYIDVFQTIGGDEQIREEKVKYGYFYNNKFYKDPEHRIEITDYTSEGNGTVFYIAVNDSNKIYIRQGNSWVQRTDIAKKTLPQVLNSGVNAVKWSENNILGAKNFIPIPDSGQKSIFNIDHGEITILKLTGLESTQTYIVYLNEVLYGQYYFTIDCTIGSSTVIPSNKLKIGMIENTNQESFITPYFGQTGHLNGSEQLTIASSNGIKGFKIIVESGISTSGIITMKPMLRLTSISDRTFVSHSMTNKQLTKRLPFSLATTTVDNIKTYGYLKDDGKFQAFKSQADIDAAVSAAKKAARQGNAAVGDVLKGKTFVTTACNDTTQVLTGTMTNQGAWTTANVPNLPTIEAEIPIPEGYHNGKGFVQLMSLKDLTPPKTNTTAIVSSAVLSGYSGWVNGVQITGNMFRNPATTVTLSAGTSAPVLSYTIPDGYHNGSGKVIITTQQKSWTPATSSTTIVPDNGKVLSKVTVAAVNLNGSAVASQVMTGQTFYSTSLTPMSGTMPTVVASTIDLSTKSITDDYYTYSIPSGYHYEGGKVRIKRGSFGYYKDKEYKSGIIPDTTTNFVMDIHNSGNPSGATMEAGYYKKFSITVAPHGETKTVSSAEAYDYSNIELGDYHNYNKVNATAVYSKGKSDGRTPIVTTLWANPNRNTVGSTFTSQTIRAFYSTADSTFDLPRYDLYSITYVASTSTAWDSYERQPKTLYFFPEDFYTPRSFHVDTVFEEITKKIKPMLDETIYAKRYLDELYGFYAEDPGQNENTQTIFYLGMRSAGGTVYRRKIGIKGYIDDSFSSGVTYLSYNVYISFGNSSNGDGATSNNTNVPLVICGINFG